MAAHDLMDRIVNLAKRRGLVFPSSEIYGGFRSTWDYGPLGVLLKRNVKDAWWRSMVQLRDDVVGLDAAILMAPRVWEASGHVATFTDPLVDCRNCNERFRADQLPASGVCPNCGAKNSFTEARQFNLMFKTFVGPVEDDASVAYLRPETAQGIFVNFANVQTTTRKKPPFGIAQIGKSFRNEITPGNFVFRTREFEQMEMEYFVPPEDGPRWHEYWCAERFRWYTGLGIPDDMLRLRPHDAEELSHYSAGTSDVEFLYPWGWGELEGIANRTDFDLTQHAEFSGQDLSYYDQEHERRYVPHVIEPAAGADRATLAFLLAAYEEEEVANDKGGTDSRTVLHLHPRLAPVKVAVLPLSRNERLVPKADEVAAILRPRFMIDVDDAGSIGRRYRRQDEVGTPLCVTVDFDSLDDQAVTIRDRDTMSQDRVPIEKLVAELEGRLALVTDDTYYDTLGVSKEATRDEMRAAYRARVEELEASREGKGVTDSALQANKEQTARVRAAWNVLSDPFQRDRYDAEIESGTGTGAGDDDSGDAAETAAPGTELTGWRRLIAPPPPRNGSAGKPAPARAANPRARTPTVVLPAGMTLADNRNRGMALLFDVSALLLIFIVVSYLVPPLVRSDYRDIYDRSTKLQKTADKASDKASKADDKVSNAEDKVAAAKKTGDSSALSDAEDQLTAAKDAKQQAHATADATQKAADTEHAKLSTANLVVLVVSGVLMLLYLVPVAARTGKTIGMWRRNLRIVRVDGSRLTFGPALIRYGLPIALSLVLYPAMGQLAFVIGLFAVLWGFRDPNKQGIHDKLAKTLVVSAT